MAEEKIEEINEIDNQQNENEQQENPAPAGSEKKYSDEDMNNIVKRNTSKAEQKLLKSLGITDVEKAKEILKAAAEAEISENDTQAKTLEQVTQRAVKAEIKNILAEKGFAGKKADRMLNFLSLDECINENGEVDAQKVESELESVKSDFPELFSADEKAKGGFRFGSDGDSEHKGEIKKPAENKKRWNRFNN